MKRKRPALFSGYVYEDGVRRRLRREELALAWRLWWQTRRHSARGGAGTGTLGALPADEPRPT
jgi:hypothetical protein